MAFVDSHAVQIKLRSVDRKAIAPLDPVAMITGAARNNPFVTVPVDNEILCLGGVMILWKGVGEAWIGTSDLVERYPLAFTRAVKSYLDSVIGFFNLHRVQANVVAGHERGFCWVQRLGFELEAVMKKYGPNGEDYYRYVRLP